MLFSTYFDVFKSVRVHYTVINVTFSSIPLTFLILCWKVSLNKIQYVFKFMIHVFKIPYIDYFKTANRYVLTEMRCQLQAVNSSLC